MKGKIEWAGKWYALDFREPKSISLTINNGNENPNCYFSEPVKFDVIRTKNFVGSIAEGGNVNHQKIILSPHGNGTHTECSGHIFDNNNTIAKTLTVPTQIAQLITVDLTKHPDGDTVISLESIQEANLIKNVTALIIRTSPNAEDKRSRNYSGKNPPYFAEECMKYLVKYGIEHLVVDLPSIDKEVDGGSLRNHNNFWDYDSDSRTHCTITELAYIENDIADGTYLLDLQCLKIALDVTPSNPILYSLNPI